MQYGFRPDAATVSFGQQPNESRAEQCQPPVFDEEFSDQKQRIVVVGEEDFIGRESFLRVVEIDRIGEVDDHHEQSIDCDVVPEKQVPVPLFFAQVQRQEREQYECAVGIADRRRIEKQRTAQ